MVLSYKKNSRSRRAVFVHVRADDSSAIARGLSFLTTSRSRRLFLVPCFPTVEPLVTKPVLFGRL